MSWSGARYWEEMVRSPMGQECAKGCSRGSGRGADNRRTFRKARMTTPDLARSNIGTTQEPDVPEAKAI